LYNKKEKSQVKEEMPSRGSQVRQRGNRHGRNNDRSPSNYSSYNRQKMKNLNNKNTNRLRNQSKFINAVNLLQSNIYKSGLNFLLSLKNQFQIYEKDASVLESRGAFMITPHYQQMKASGNLFRKFSFSNF
jgi:hypothetical protein